MNLSGISLRLSVTDACQLQCRYCRPTKDTRSAIELPAADVMMAVASLHKTVGIAKLRITGGEPLLRRDLMELLSSFHTFGIPDLALTTNGQRLALVAADLKRSGLRRVNISLDSLSPEGYAAITHGGRLADTIAGVDAALAAGLSPVKINMVVLRGVNDHELADMLAFGIRYGCQVRFLELMPIGMATDRFTRQYVAGDEIQRTLAKQFDLSPLPYETGATSRNFLATAADGRQTVCGLISPTSRPFCQGCRRLRLTAEGRLLGCLASRRSIDLRQALAAAKAGDNQPLTLAIAQAMGLKHQVHDLAAQRDMSRIGG